MNSCPAISHASNGQIEESVALDPALDPAIAPATSRSLTPWLAIAVSVVCGLTLVAATAAFAFLGIIKPSLKRGEKAAMDGLSHRYAPALNVLRAPLPTVFRVAGAGWGSIQR